MVKKQLIILANEQPDDHLLWIKACEAHLGRVDYRVVDLTKNNWLTEIINTPFDWLLAKPGGLTAPFKQLYDERVYILGKVLGYPIYPSVEEMLVYENKRFLSYWLKAKNIPHPETNVFYVYREAMEFLENTEYPVVAKTNIGASGSGVKLLSNIRQALDYTRETFSARGAAKRSGPNLAKGGLIRRGLHYLLHPVDIKKKLNIYKAKRNDIQSGFVIFQSFIPHDFEWRAVRIGDSYFAHKKLKSGEKASGSLLKAYDNPPLNIFAFVNELTDFLGFTSVAVDLFEYNGNYLVNEIQCIFGQSDPYQMLVDGKPGRYRYIGGKWVFEEGDFNRFQSFELRLLQLLNLCKQ